MPVVDRAERVEHLTITATDNDSTSGKLSIATATNIESVLIENVSANACYITWAKSSAPTADNTMYELLAGANVEIDNMSFIYFATINKSAGNNSTIVITANYIVVLINVFKIIYDSIKELISNEFTVKTGLDKNNIKIGEVDLSDMGEFGEGFLTIVPTTDIHEEFLAKMDERRYTVELTYYRTFQRLSKPEFDTLTDFGQRLIGLLDNNSDYSPSGVQKWFGGIVESVDYVPDLSDLEELSDEPLQGVAAVQLTFSVTTATEFV